MFTANDLSARVRQRPFTPFRIATSGGESFDITHPELIWVGRRDVHIGFADATDPVHYDQAVRVAIMHITTIRDLPVGAPPAGGNGEAP